MKVKCRGKEFDVYSLPEALSLDIIPIGSWRKANAGDWIRTADNKVIKVIGRREKKAYPKNKESKKKYLYIRTGYGEHGAHKSKIYASKQPDYYYDKAYHGKDLIRNVRSTTLQKSFVDNLMEFGNVNSFGMWDTESIISSYQSVYSDNNPDQSLRRGLGIIKKQHIREYISMNLRDRLIEKGVDDDWVIDQYKILVDGDVPYATKLNALNRISDLLGHNTKERTEENIEGMFALTDGEIKQLASVRKKFATTNYLVEQVKHEKNGITEEE